MADVEGGMVFLGGPGAGKGTQAKRLAASHDLLHISTGDMLREHVAGGTELGRQAQTFMDAGNLVPDDVMIGMVAERIQRPDAAKAWILDGFPRTLPQAEALDASLSSAPDSGTPDSGSIESADRSLRHVIYFQVPEDVLIQRLTSRRTCSKCGEIWNLEFKPPRRDGICDACDGELTQRPDDRPEAVKERQAVYRSLTEPLLGYYRSQGKLREIDANRSPELVLADVLGELIS